MAPLSRRRRRGFRPDASRIPGRCQQRVTRLAQAETLRCRDSAGACDRDPDSRLLLYGGDNLSYCDSVGAFCPVLRAISW